MKKYSQKYFLNFYSHRLFLHKGQAKRKKERKKYFHGFCTVCCCHKSTVCFIFTPCFLSLSFSFSILYMNISRPLHLCLHWHSSLSHPIVSSPGTAIYLFSKLSPLHVLNVQTSSYNLTMSAPLLRSLVHSPTRSPISMSDHPSARWFSEDR